MKLPTPHTQGLWSGITDGKLIDSKKDKGQKSGSQMAFQLYPSLFLLPKNPLPIAIGHQDMKTESFSLVHGVKSFQGYQWSKQPPPKAPCHFYCYQLPTSLLTPGT